MRISLGILAWNEAEVIGVSLKALFAQGLFRRLSADGPVLQIVIIPNGCRDGTGRIAEETLRRLAADFDPRALSWAVHSLDEAGKAHAWNRFVHDFADPAADYVFLMDADIRLHAPDTLWNMVQALEGDPYALVATDTPLKHVLFKKRKSPADRISLAIADMTRAAPAQITGQLYCSRGAALRRIHMPKGLLTEDGFLRNMVCTDLLRAAPDHRRVVRAPDASHVFESYTRLRDVFFNQRRQQVAHAILVFLLDFLRERAGERDAGAVIRDENARDPDWFGALVRRRVAEAGAWAMYPGAFGTRWRRLRGLPPADRLRRFPAALAAAAMDAVVLVAANRTLRRGTLRGVWKDTKSPALAAAGSPGADPRTD